MKIQLPITGEERRRRESVRSICFTWVPIESLGKPNIYQNLGDFTRIGKIVEGVSDCEELVGVTDKDEMGLFFVGDSIESV